MIYIYHVYWAQNETENIIVPELSTVPIIDFIYEDIDYEDITIFGEFVENEVRSWIMFYPLDSRKTKKLKKGVSWRRNNNNGKKLTKMDFEEIVR